MSFPREFLEAAARRRLLGLRFPGVGGRGLPWTNEMVALEELGVLGTALPCLFARQHRRRGDRGFGTDDQKERFLAPLRGRGHRAEALTEPARRLRLLRGDDDRPARRRHVLLTGQKRFVVGAEGADVFLVYAGRIEDVSDPKAA